ncbi:MAG: hypothetical protein ACTSPY_03350 [Candidatus Helarchaeota archaeon]
MIKLIVYRLITPDESNQLKLHLNYFNKSVFDSLTKSNTLLVGEGIRKEIFLVSEKLYTIFLNIKKNKEPYFLGIYLGNLTDNKFDFSLNCLQLLNKFTNKKIMINTKGEIQFIYGKDVQKRHILRVFDDLIANDRIIVINKKYEPLGLGLTLFPIRKNLQSNKIKIINLMDIGWYLRKGH